MRSKTRIGLAAIALLLDSIAGGHNVNSELTDIVIVLDRSGSMESIKSDVKGGFDKLIESQKKCKGDAQVTLVQFDMEYESVYRAKPIKDVPSLDLRPRGMTALLDALGRSIVETGERLEKMSPCDRPGRVVFVVITDGLENSSKEFQKSKINEMIKHQKEKYNWQFVFLAANQDAIQEGGALGFGVNQSLNFVPTSGSIKVMFDATNVSLSNFRGGFSTDVSYSDDQKEEVLSGK